MRVSIFLLLLTFFLPLTVRAVSSADISVNVTPENPSPGETVTITLKSYLANLDSVSISWAVNQKTSAVGVGKKTFSIIAPDRGAEIRVSATIALPDGSIAKEVIIRPAVMALLWQANNAYVPPFYKGKALPSIGSEVKLVAIPEIKVSSRTVNPKNMVYAWKKDYTNDPGASGYGKNFYTYTNDYLENSSFVNVVASTTDQKYSSAGSLAVGTFEPQILFYKADPEVGILWQNALRGGHRIQGEEIVVAAPYFLSPKDIRTPSLSWSWSINDTYVTAPEFNPNFLPLQAQAGTSGTSIIKLEITNKYNLLTSAQKELAVEF
ncbi:MAG: hypothetical protein M3M85_01685 [bacterium]|nr:hypothetical protein [bacterium]